MKKILPILLLLIFPAVAKAQFENFRDSVVQLYGVVMTADSLHGLPAASVVVKGQNRGTITNEQGVFSIVVLKGDKIEFTNVGFKPVRVEIPRNILGNQYNIVQLMVEDTVYLPATIIKARPTREQFERDFVRLQIPDDDLAIAKKNIDEQKRRFYMNIMSYDAREASNAFMRNQSVKQSYNRQYPPMNILNPAAWTEFIRAWKRGDFKKKQ